MIRDRQNYGQKHVKHTSTATASATRDSTNTPQRARVAPTIGLHTTELALPQQGVAAGLSAKLDDPLLRAPSTRSKRWPSRKRIDRTHRTGQHRTYTQDGPTQARTGREKSTHGERFWEDNSNKLPTKMEQAGGDTSQPGEKGGGGGGCDAWP